MKLAAPLIIAAHVAKLPTLTGWAGVKVSEGALIRRDDVREFVTLGYVAGDTGAPTISLEPMPQSQGQTAEQGRIACQLVSNRADVPTARARLFDLVTAWAAWLDSDRTLGGVLLANSDTHLALDLALSVTKSGATADATVTITYATTTYG